MWNLSLRTGFLPAIIITAIIAGIFYWTNQQHFESTNHSYVNARIIQIAPEVDGKIAQVFIEDHQKVKRGELLFELEQAPFIIAINKAEAQFNESKRYQQERQASVLAAQALIKQRETELENAKTLAKRTQMLANKGYRADQENDDANARIKAAEASLSAAKAKLEIIRLSAGTPGETNERVATAVAALNKAQLNANRSKVYAPADGIISNLSLHPGEVISAKQPLFKIVTTDNLWIDAQFDESQLHRIHQGQIATINFALYPDQTFHGVVENIASTTTGLNNLHNDNPKRVAVKIRLTDTDPNKYPLRIGTTAKVNIDVNSSAKQPIIAD